MDKIVVKNATKCFGEQKALDDLSLTFETGKIHGIIGRNGSGKTVLFKCICGFMQLNSGSITVDGKCIGKDIESPDNLGVIIENPGFLPHYNGYQNLKFLADINGVLRKKDILAVLDRVGLGNTGKKHVGKYSMGMIQRLGIAQAIMENPDLLILDEPMNGLDNRGVEDVRNLLLSLKEEGVTILLASHNREDISILCDTVVEIDQGRIVEKSK